MILGGAHMSEYFLTWLAGVTIPTVATGVAMGLLLTAAWHDLRSRLIPDTICVILAILGCAFRLHVGVIDFAFSVAVSLLLFFLLFAAFNRSVVGGGDVKLMVATGLWLSPVDCYIFIVVTAMAGGVLAVLHLLVRSVSGSAVAVLPRVDAGLPDAQSIPAAAGIGVPFSRNLPERISVGGVMRAELERIRSGCPLPYGMAIAAGGCYAMLNSLRG